MLEHEIQQAILARIGCSRVLTVWRNNTGTIRDHRGVPVRFGLVGSADVLGVAMPSGRFIAIEVKQPGARLTPSQKAFGEMVRAHGAVYVLAHSVDEAIDGLRAHGIEV